MDIFAKIAGEKIKEAMERGEFDNLSGKGRPLFFEDETLVREEMRLAYKILKNAGCVPQEVELKKEINDLRDLIRISRDKTEALKKLKELNYKLTKFNMLTKMPCNLTDMMEEKDKKP